ncbi:MAG: exopolyphosphatase [Bacteroidota bacterium]|nr:exopolyphosphatase [Bacteroidota bacterium]
MLIAGIDIGSNAARLYFSNVFEHEGEIIVEKASLVRIPVRLGEDVFNDGYISKSKIDNLVKTLSAYKLLIEVYEPVVYKAVATAAMREAINNKEVVSYVFEKTGIEIEIIDGIKEANMVCAVHNFANIEKERVMMFVDVGGGSTEISLNQGERIIDSASFRIGTIRMLKDKVEQKEWDRLKQWLKPYRKNPTPIICIGSGGNINKIAKLYGDRNDSYIPYETLVFSNQHLSSFNLEERIEDLGLRPDRADVIIPAARIYINVLKWSNIDKIYVPKIGLSDGIVYNLYKEFKSKNVVPAKNERGTIQSWLEDLE